MTGRSQITDISDELLGIDQTIIASIDDFLSIVSEKSRQVNREIIARWLAECEYQEPETQTLCCECGLEANFVSRKATMARTQFGMIRYKRAYYVCPHCHHSTAPLDERLNPFQSLARLRAKIAAGKFLPVAEMAKAWGLGSLNGVASDLSVSSLIAPQANHKSSMNQESLTQVHAHFCCPV